MRTRYFAAIMSSTIFFTAALLLPCVSRAGDSFMVGSYNIHSFVTMHKQKDVAGTIRAIGALQSDICGLQEVRKYDHENPAPLELAGQKLAMQPFFCRTLRRGNFEYGIGTLSKLPAEVVANVKLPIAPRREARSVQIIKVKLAGGSFYFVNTHLQNGKGEDERTQQIKTIMDYLEKHQLYPAILTGDLNAGPASNTIRLLKSKWKIVGDNKPTFPASKPRAKIDYIAFYPADAFEVISYEVVNEPNASDHAPIKARLKLLKK